MGEIQVSPEIKEVFDKAITETLEDAGVTLNDLEVKPEIDQVEVDKLKEQLIEQIRYKNPRLYYKIKTGQDYHPWERTDNVEAGIPGLRLHRNDLCKCGSNLKVKKCCGIKAYYTVPKVEKKN